MTFKEFTTLCVIKLYCDKIFLPVCKSLPCTNLSIFKGDYRYIFFRVKNYETTKPLILKRQLRIIIKYLA